MIDDYNVNGDYLSERRSGHRPITGRLCIDFSFNSSGANKFSHLTRRKRPRPGHRLRTQPGHRAGQRPAIGRQRSKARSATAARSPADFNEEYVDFVVGVLNAGSLPAALQKEPISEQKISAQLGDDTIRSGSNRA